MQLLFMAYFYSGVYVCVRVSMYMGVHACMVPGIACGLIHTQVAEGARRNPVRPATELQVNGRRTAHYLCLLG